MTVMSVAAPIIMSNKRLGSSAALKYEATSCGLGYKNAVNDSTANRYTNTTNKRVSNIAADTFHDATARRRVSVKMACEDVIQMKNRKMTAPCASSKGMRNAPCVTRRISNGTSSVVTNPVTQVRRE